METIQTARRQAGLQLAGGLLWFANLVWFFGQFAAQSAWRTPYSVAHNFVSDLGATNCGEFPPGSGSYVCSPLHAVMNTSFVLWGAVWLLGGVLFAFSARLARTGRVAHLLIALGGAGTIVIGFVPENVDFTVHALAALVQTFGVAAGLTILGIQGLRRHHVPTSVLTLLVALASVVGIVATAAAADGGTFAGLGLGVWERIALWPLPIWLAAAGVGQIWRLVVPADTSSTTAGSPTGQPARVRL